MNGWSHGRVDGLDPNSNFNDCPQFMKANKINFCSHLKRDFGLEIFCQFGSHFLSNVFLLIFSLLRANCTWNLQVSWCCRRNGPLNFPVARRCLIFPLNDQMTPTILVLIYRDALWQTENDTGTMLEWVCSQSFLLWLLWLSSPDNFLEHRHMLYLCICMFESPQYHFRCPRSLGFYFGHGDKPTNGRT